MASSNVLIDRNPTSLAEYIGNEKIKQIIAITIDACKQKNLQLSNTLITGQRGTGKTTLATLLAKELKMKYKLVSAEAIKTLGQLNDMFLNNLPDMLIIDEIHGIKAEFSDMMHQAMDDFKYSYADEDDVMRTASIHPFTLIGCTTDPGKLTIPFYSRFPKKFHLQLYTNSNLQKIIMNVARNNHIDIDNAAAFEIARRSNQVPRNAVLHFQNIYEYAIKYNSSIINHDIVCAALDLHDIDESGLGPEQRNILKALSLTRSAMGLDNIAQRVGCGKEEVMLMHEPYLLKIGFIERTSNGRKITQAGMKHLQGLKL